MSSRSKGARRRRGVAWGELGEGDALLVSIQTIRSAVGCPCDRVRHERCRSRAPPPRRHDPGQKPSKSTAGSLPGRGVLRRCAHGRRRPAPGVSIRAGALPRPHERVADHSTSSRRRTATWTRRERGSRTRSSATVGRRVIRSPRSAACCLPDSERLNERGSTAWQSGCA